MNIKWLVADVTAVEAPDIAEHAILGMIFCWALFWPIQAVSVVREPLCDVVTHY